MAGWPEALRKCRYMEMRRKCGNSTDSVVA